MQVFILSRYDLKNEIAEQLDISIKAVENILLKAFWIEKVPCGERSFPDNTVSFSDRLNIPT